MISSFIWFIMCPELDNLEAIFLRVKVQGPGFVLVSGGRLCVFAIDMSPGRRIFWDENVSWGK